MARGHEDWGINTGQLAFVDADTAELAVRLGSPNVWRRSGRVIYIDGFEGSLAPWLKLTGGTGSAAEIVREFSNQGSGSVRITPGSDGNQRMILEKRLPYFPNARTGMEVAMWPLNGVTALKICLIKHTATERVAFHIRVRPAEKDVSYWTNPGGYTIIADIHDVIDVNTNFFLLKMIVDFETNQYIRAYLNETEYSLSGISAGIDVIGGDNRYLVAQLRTEDTSGGQALSYMDDLIVTIDEQ